MNGYQWALQYTRMRAELLRLKRNCYQHFDGDEACQCERIDAVLDEPERTTPAPIDPLAGGPAFTWTNLVELARKDPAVFAMLRLEQMGQYTREELLLALVGFLAQRSDEQRRSMASKLENEPPMLRIAWDERWKKGSVK